MIQPAEPTIKPALLTRNDTAIYLSVTTRTVDKLAAEGKLKRVKIGSKTLFRVSDLDQFIQECVES